MTVRSILARPLTGPVGETKRVRHLFPAPSEETSPARLAAFCGAEFGPGELERLDAPQGMLVQRSARSSVSVPVISRHARGVR